MWDAQENGEATHICDCVRLASMANKMVYDAPVVIDEAHINKSLKDPKNNRKTIRAIIPNLGF